MESFIFCAVSAAINRKSFLIKRVVSIMVPQYLQNLFLFITKIHMFIDINEVFQIWKQTFKILKSYDHQLLQKRPLSSDFCMTYSFWVLSATSWFFGDKKWEASIGKLKKSITEANFAELLKKNNRFFIYFIVLSKKNYFLYWNYILW